TPIMSARVATPHVPQHVAGTTEHVPAPLHVLSSGGAVDPSVPPPASESDAVCPLHATETSAIAPNEASQALMMNLRSPSYASRAWLQLLRLRRDRIAAAAKAGLIIAKSFIVAESDRSTRIAIFAPIAPFQSALVRDTG